MKRKCFIARKAGPLNSRNRNYLIDQLISLSPLSEAIKEDYFLGTTFKTMQGKRIFSGKKAPSFYEERAPLEAPTSESQPSSQMVAKLPLEGLVEKSLKDHAEECPGEVMIPLGDMADIDLKDSGEYPIWIQNGVVYHLIKCPGLPHEILARDFTFAIRTAFSSFLGRDVLTDSGSADWQLTNELGCHATFKKQPDSSLALRTPFTQGQTQPVLIVEVASAHESLHVLLCEVAAWLNRSTDVVYVLAIKIWPYSKHQRLCLMLFSRNDKLTVSTSPTTEEPKASTSLTEQVPSQPFVKRYCMKNERTPPKELLKKEVLAERYGLYLVQLEFLEDAPQEETFLCFDMVKLLAKSTIPFEEIKHRICHIPLRELLKSVYVEYRARTKKQ